MIQVHFKVTHTYIKQFSATGMRYAPRCYRVFMQFFVHCNYNRESYELVRIHMGVIAVRPY